ncbi:MAG TPA: hypothetical protein VGM20_04410 [Gemmatimonadales bacterium]|jgi:hypothetical protein
MSCSHTEIEKILRADITMRRGDRIAVAISMRNDGFAARDIARIASLRMRAILQLGRAMGLKPGDRRQGSRGNRYGGKSDAARPCLGCVATAIVNVPLDGLEAVCETFGIGFLSGYGIRRAMLYATKVATAGDPVWYRCADCGQVTPTHPCAHCGASWLADAA